MVQLRSQDPSSSAAVESSLSRAYLEAAGQDGIDYGALSFYASLDQVSVNSPDIAQAIIRELAAQRSNVKLIASENYSSLATQVSQGNLLVDKYAEGFVGHRFYAGCENVDAIEREASDLARALFGAEYAYVQPHSGADANLVAFLAILRTRVEVPELEKGGWRSPLTVPAEEWTALREKLGNQRLLAMDFFSGGHLTHGYRFNFSSRLFDAHTYTVDRETKLVDLDALRRQLHEVRPLILLAGYSAYPRRLDFAKMRELADEVGAVFMVDMAHFAGLVAGKVFEGDYDPVPFAHVVTSTTHKTLRGPRGGIVLAKQEFAESIDKGCPIVLGGPLPHVMAAKAVAFREASQPSFADYAHRIVENARALAAGLVKRDVEVVTGGTDNHLVLADVARSFGLTGWQGEGALRACGITLNRNGLPFDEMGAWFTSGLRLGSAAVTSLGMGTDEMDELAGIIKDVLAGTRPADGDARARKAEHVLDAGVAERARARVHELLGAYPLYPELDLELIRSTPVGAAALGPAES